MAITRVTDTDDSGNGTSGTVHNNAWLQSIYDSIEGASPANFGCNVYNNTTQSVNDQSWADLTFNTELFDNGGLHSTVSNTHLVTIPTGGAGIYLVIAQAAFNPDKDGFRILVVAKNSAGIASTSVVAADVTPSNPSIILQASAVVSLAVADTIKASVYHSAGAALNVGSSAPETSNRLTVVRLI